MNFATATTSLFAGVNERAVSVRNSSTGTKSAGVVAFAGTAPAHAVTTPTGVWGETELANGHGVHGRATGQNGVGVYAESAGHAVFATTSGQFAAGVYGTGTEGYGVLGNATAGTAVSGNASGAGIGVFGGANQGTGVRARSTGGTALSVDGTNVFSQAGRGTFAVGETQHAIDGVRLTSKSGVVATLNTTPGDGVYLIRARINLAESRIVLVLNQPATSAAHYTYFIVDAP